MPHRLGVVAIREGDRTEIEHLLAARSHWCDVPLVASRREGPGSELPRADVDFHRQGVRDGYADDASASHERLCLCRADPNRLRLVAVARVADVDIVAAVRQRHPGLVPDADVLRARALLVVS